MTEQQWRRVKAGLVILLLLVTVGSLWAAQAARRGESIALANARAANDNVQALRVVLRGTDDTVIALSKLVPQLELQVQDLGDSLGGLEAALRSRNVAHIKTVAGLRVTLDSVTQEKTKLERDLVTLGRDLVEYRVIRVVTTDSSGIQADLYLTVPTDTLKAAEVEWARFTVPPINISSASGCTKDKDFVLTLQGPEWAPIQLTGQQVDPTVCHGPKRSLAFTLFGPSLGKLVWAGAGFAAGYAVAEVVGGAEANVYVTPRRAELRLGEIRW
jgi:hypothetical protein